MEERNSLINPSQGTASQFQTIGNIIVSIVGTGVLGFPDCRLARWIPWRYCCVMEERSSTMDPEVKAEQGPLSQEIIEPRRSARVKKTPQALTDFVLS
ncbi:hypothetical protein V6N13_025063 [Hibiscus sabdariffa]|uniref:Uncharacterized protein n=2 Tax=Hibiscus sabdariffa TaxID=183260 RepID=A0ABR2A6H7_9ROSI